VTNKKIAAALHYISLILGAACILYMDRHAWFIGDDFGFFGRMQTGTSLDLLTPYNGHLSAIPLLLIKVWYHIFGLTHFVAYTALNVAVHLVVVHLLWRWMRRLGADIWVATCLAAVFLLLGAGVEALWSWFQVTFALTMVFGFAGLEVIDRQSIGLKHEVAYWICGLAAVLTSGVGVIMLALAFLTALRHGWQRALRVVSVPLVFYAVWFVAIGRHDLAQQAGYAWQKTLIPQYVWTGLSSDIDATTGFAGVGAVLLVGIVFWMYRRRDWVRTARVSAFAAAAAAVLFFFLLATDRVSAGLWESKLTRYGYVAMALLIPVISLIASEFFGRNRISRALVVGLSGVFVINGVGNFATFLATWDPITEATHAQAVATARMITSDAALAVGPDASVESLHSTTLTLGLLRSVMQAGRFKSSDPVSAAEQLTTEMLMQVSVTAQPVAKDVTMPSLYTAYEPVVLRQGGCVTVSSVASRPSVILIFAHPGYVSIRTQASGDADIQLAPSQDPQATTAATNTVSLISGQLSYLNVTASGVAVKVVLPAGASSICGLA
jgi:hypothetical protein